MPVLICLREKLWTRTYSIRDQVPTCPVFTRAKIKTRFGISKNLPSHKYNATKENFREHVLSAKSSHCILAEVPTPYFTMTLSFFLSFFSLFFFFFLSFPSSFFLSRGFNLQSWQLNKYDLFWFIFSFSQAWVPISIPPPKKKEKKKKKKRKEKKKREKRKKKPDLFWFVLFFFKLVFHFESCTLHFPKNKTTTKKKTK